jgi:hypothetical protein
MTAEHATVSNLNVYKMKTCIKFAALITRDQVPPPPKLRREKARMTLHEDNMNSLMMELVRFTENKIVCDEMRDTGAI